VYEEKEICQKKEAFDFFVIPVETGT